MRMRISLVVGVLALAPSLAWAANCCSLNGGPCNIIPPLVHGVSPWTGPVCGTTISGTNCTAELDADVNAASGSCLTLGSGVTLDFNGYTLNCTGSCTTAVLNTSSGATTAAVKIESGAISGPWATGVSVTGGTNSSVAEMVVAGCDTCISSVRGKIDHTVVRNCPTLGIDLYPGEDLESVVVRNNGNSASNGYGLRLTGSTGSTTMDNVLFIANRVDMHFDHASGTPSVQRSEFQEAVTCGCYLDLGPPLQFCLSADSCLTITNSTTPTIIDDDFFP